jgi:hypothetical protein
MLNFCTLFDSRYLTRGIAMYESLKKHSADFHLYIFPFDEKSLEILKKLDLEHVTLVTAKEFEDEELLNAKSNRESGEYCWTCTPAIILYLIEKYNLSECTYIDADLYFFSDPKILNDEMGDKSVCIIEHRYTEGIKIEWVTKRIDDDEMKRIIENISGDEKKILHNFYESNPAKKAYDLKKEITKEDSLLVRDILFKAGHVLFSDFGKYCVQFMTFKNDEKGLKVLKAWKKDCIDWCYAKVEDGKFGDQKYLDYWPAKFEGIAELQNSGGGLAPWNIKSYDISKNNKKIFIKSEKNGRIDELVFFHFAALRFFNVHFVFGKINLFKTRRMQLANEDFGTFSKTVVKLIYKPYIKHLIRIKNLVNKIDNSFDPNGSFKQYKFLENLYLKEKRRIEN